MNTEYNPLVFDFFDNLPIRFIKFNLTLCHSMTHAVIK